MPLIYIILVNFNSYKDTIECVRSLKKINYLNYKIVIVDNNSKNDSVKELKKHLNDCIIIESKNNKGFSGGNNLAIEYSIKNGAEYVLLLNNDTLVNPNFLTNMINSYNKINNVGIVTCKILYYPEQNKIWYGGGKINWFKFIVEHYGMGEFDIGQTDLNKEVDFATGCCMLVKIDVLKKVGLLSDEYFMYFEDVDFCVRVKEAGYRIWYNHNAIIYHKVGQASGGEESSFSIEWCTRNRLFFMKKYKNRVPKFQYFLSLFFFYITRIIRYLEYKIKNDNDRANAILSAIRYSR